MAVLVLRLTSLCHTVLSCVTEPYGFELLTLPRFALFLAEDGLRIIRNVSK